MTAIRVSGPAGPTPAPVQVASPPPVAVPATISLYELVREVRSGTTSTTAVPRPATVPPTTTTTTTGPVSQLAASSPPPSTTTTTTTLTPLTTLLQQLAPAIGALSGSDGGIASWFYAPAGTCAHRDLPLGTVVTVTRLSTGASTTCRVADRGPTLATKRVIDLSPDVFEKLASRDAGVIEVLIAW